ncbi:YwdI family protein [Thalassobacillus devorans]|uniref:YwdI family protein n=1 Tax=Thalassobacillus devorans TaxID=279813 RepID=UPI000A1CEF86|nr:YwdI family protein [Thalassobacillus devorans]
MAISNETVLKKMMNEIQEAMANHGETASVREHVRAVRLLCDLMLDDRPAPDTEERVSSYPDPTDVSEPTADEVRAMMGDMAGSSYQKKEKKKQKDEHDEANGDSIFDF